MCRHTRFWSFVFPCFVQFNLLMCVLKFSIDKNSALCFVSCIFVWFYFVRSLLRRGLAFCIFFFFLSFFFAISQLLLWSFWFRRFICGNCLRCYYLYWTHKRNQHIFLFNSLLIWLNTNLLFFFCSSIVYRKRHHHTQNAVHTLNISLSFFLSFFSFFHFRSISFYVCSTKLMMMTIIIVITTIFSSPFFSFCRTMCMCWRVFEL